MVNEGLLPAGTLRWFALSSRGRTVISMNPTPETRSSLQAPMLRPSLSPTTTKRRSEEHTSELQSRSDLVCRLLLEKKKGREAVPHDVRLGVYVLSHSPR